MNVPIPDATAAEMIKYGQVTFESGLIYGNFGNLSTRRDGVVYITRSGAMLGKLSKEDFVAVRGLSIPEEASSDTPIHLSIYEKTNCGAIYHMHGDFTLVMSWIHDVVEPMDFAGSRFLGPVSVVEGVFGTPTLTDAIVKNLRTNAVIVRGHGSFTVGPDLRQAYIASCALETSCKLSFFEELYQRRVLDQTGG